MTRKCKPETHPRYRTRVRIGPRGWWCCARPMRSGHLPSGEVRICVRCDCTILVSGNDLEGTLSDGVPRRRRLFRRRHRPSKKQLSLPL